MKNNSKNDGFRFLGPERYYSVAGRQLDEKTNDGTDDFVNVQGKYEKTTIGSIIAVGIVAIAITSLVCIAVRPKKAEKLNSAGLKPAVFDDAGIIGGTGSLTATLDEYSDLTGICPVVYTVYEEDWNSDYEDLQTYTLHKYADNFKDMQHFVVVCSIPENEAEKLSQGEAIEPHYEVEAVNGPGTNSFISQAVLNRFCSTVRKELAGGSAPSSALGSGFRYAIGDADSRIHPFDGRYTGKLLLSFSPVLIVSLAFITVLFLVSRKFKKDRAALAAGAAGKKVT